MHEGIAFGRRDLTPKFKLELIPADRDYKTGDETDVTVRNIRGFLTGSS